MMMLLQVCCVLIFEFLINLKHVSGTITVVLSKTNESILKLNDKPAAFVETEVSVYGKPNYVVYAEPDHACSSVQPPPFTVKPKNFILVARRHDCLFYEKILNAEKAGYAGIIIHNVKSSYTFEMDLRDLEGIFATFVGERDGHMLRDKFNYTSGYYIRIEDNKIKDDVLENTGDGMPLVLLGIFGVIVVIMVILCICDNWEKTLRYWSAPDLNSDKETGSDSGSGRDSNNGSDFNGRTDPNNDTESVSNTDSDSDRASNNRSDSNGGTDSNNDTESVSNTDSDSDTDLHNMLFPFQGFNKTSRRLTLRLKARVADPDK